jgi:hypothetical protein
VSAPACAAAVSFATLVDYWFGDHEASIEEHLFGCEHCTRRLEELAALGSGICAAFRAGAVRAVIPRALLEAMKKEQLRVREYRLTPGASIECTIAAADDFVVGRLEAPLAGVNRVDVLDMNEHGELQSRLEDVPFDPATGEVLVLPAPAVLRKKPAHKKRVRLIAVDTSGERTLGEYTFVHTPG